MYNIAILGASGAVGTEMINCLFDRKFPLKNLILLGSEKSNGKTKNTPFGDILMQEVNEQAFVGVDFALFSAGGDISKQWAHIAISKGAIVIDNSSAFRYEKDVPLVIPEINPQAIGNARLIANPNCTTAIAAVVLWPIHLKYQLEHVIISTYQATSGAGASAMQELLDSTQAYLDKKEFQHQLFVHPIAFNLIPQIDKFQNNGYTKEEMKVLWETQKIFNDTNIKLSCTAVRIPTLRVHSESITIKTKNQINILDLQNLLKNSPGVDLIDEPEKNIYPMPITATSKYNIQVGRIRQNLIYGENGVDLFVAGDQLLKGAALNAVQIMETIIL